jgi:hypothetical protein
VLYGNGVFAVAAATYGNANVATFLASYGSNTITTTGNVSAGAVTVNGTMSATVNNSGVIENALTLTNAGSGVAGVSASFVGPPGVMGLIGTQYTGSGPDISAMTFKVLKASVLTTTLSLTESGAAVTGAITATGNITGGNLTTAGTMTAATVTETSSLALKENFRPIENPLEKVLQLLGQIYDRKDGSSKDEAGLVAEDVYKIIPNLVKTDSNGNPESVFYSRLSVYLLESIKVLNDEIAILKGTTKNNKK